jgi:hypothetical protein
MGAYVTRDPVAPADVAWTIFESLGINPQTRLVTPDGRPVEALESGRNVEELFA